jgi:alpha-tubulin suppressor-like RCC1 family protein
VFVEVACGETHTAALALDGQVYTWGADGAGPKQKAPHRVTAALEGLRTDEVLNPLNALLKTSKTLYLSNTLCLSKTLCLSNILCLSNTNQTTLPNTLLKASKTDVQS